MSDKTTERITPEMKREQELKAKGQFTAAPNPGVVAELEAVKEVRDQLAEANTELQKQITELSEKNDILETSVEELTEVNSKLTKRVEELEAQLSAKSEAEDIDDTFEVGEDE